MLAVRSIQDVIVDSVTVKLPAGFAGKRVEVIVLPLEDNEQQPERLESLLLTAPTLSEPDLQAFGQVRGNCSRSAVVDAEPFTLRASE